MCVCVLERKSVERDCMRVFVCACVFVGGFACAWLCDRGRKSSHKKTKGTYVVKNGDF